MGATQGSDTTPPAIVATVHVVDLGRGAALAAVLRRFRRQPPSGLRWGTTALAMPLAATGAPPLNRLAVLGFWEDDAAVDAFLEQHPLGTRLGGGLEARLHPLRAHGSWPGLPAQVPSKRRILHEGPVVVVTMSDLRLGQLPRFIRTSAPAERAAVADAAMVWGTSAVRLPFAATISVWRDTASVLSYAFDRGRPEHMAAVTEGRRRPFNRGQAFIRFAPTRLSGALAGTNPIDLDAALLPEAGG